MDGWYFDYGIWMEGIPDRGHSISMRTVVQLACRNGI